MPPLKVVLADLPLFLQLQARQTGLHALCRDYSGVVDATMMRRLA
ncbi:MAG: hypothetical protein Q8J78_03345 [Moraxellaceae bacterium]|nr:hypothetical protein [Moraxellaceae bacterium]